MMTSRIRSSSLVAAIFAVFMLVMPADGQAQQIGKGKNVGIGLAGGNLLGSVTGKFYLDERSAIQGFLGTYYGYGYGGFGLSVDYLYEFATLTNPEPGRLFLGAGGGGGLLNFAGSSWVTVNGVFELGWHFSEFPLEFVIDVRPIFAFGGAAYGPYYNNSAFGIGTSGAFRFYF